MARAVDLISETDAAKIAGVSPRTLQRFTEAGYFTLEETSSGERLYSRTVLAQLFGISEQKESERIIDLDREREKREQAEDVEPAPSLKSDEEISSETPSVPTHESTQTEAPSDNTPLQEVRLEGESLNSGLTRHQEVILEMQDRLIDRLEREIHDLKNERDWLRARIEKLEEKAERDQLLLLAEAQTVRRLVTMQVQKKNSWRHALEWFGLLPPTNDLGERIAISAPQASAVESAEAKETADSDTTPPRKAA